MTPDDARQSLLPAPALPLLDSLPEPVTHPGPCHGCGAEGLMFGVVSEGTFLDLTTEGCLGRPAYLGAMADPGSRDPGYQLPLPTVVGASGGVARVSRGGGYKVTSGAPRPWTPPPRELAPDGWWRNRPLCLECTRTTVLFLRGHDLPTPAAYRWV